MESKKALYWCIQHIDEVGGTEMVSLDLMNHLADYFDITCIVTSEVTRPITYKIDERIKIFNLNISHKITRFDVYLKTYLKEKKFKEAISLFKECWKTFTSYRKGYQDKIANLIKAKPGKLICSSVDSYLLAPDGVDCTFHYHFSSSDFNSISNKFILSHARKPNKYIFLSEATLKEVELKNKEVRGKSDYIYNPIRFNPVLDTNFYNNRIIFAGRLTAQKNPLLAVKVAKELKSRGFNFSMDIYGKGDLQTLCSNYITKHELEDCVSIHDPILDIEKEFLKSDLLLITSTSEGFALIRGEAAAMSTPCVSSYWGNTVKEMIEPKKSGLIVKGFTPKNYADAIVNILKDKDTLAAYKEESFKSTRSLSHKQIISKWLEILK